MAELPPDTLNEIGVLKRREIEARILMPVLEGARRGVRARARSWPWPATPSSRSRASRGRQVARKMGGSGLEDFARSMDDWKKGDALEMDVLAQSGEGIRRSTSRAADTPSSTARWGSPRWGRSSPATAISLS